ncbi:MAG: D-alanyl-D-alanine carboxypeptidase [Lachnospiraceae bacterium]|nr:D-alanyl-D-alanine carboxypeptidase [Lachnospiraceae bacterium]
MCKLLVGRFFHRQNKKNVLSWLLLCSFLFSFLFSIHANATSTDDLIAQAEDRKKERVETNEIPGWPQGPAIGAASAVLMDADSGTILYGKNVDQKLFPASTTKLLTCILVAENCDMDEMVTVSQTAIDNKGRNGSNMALVAGEQLTVAELLHGVLINSANEACNALAEHVSGSIEAFVELMNQRAAELGCTNSHFVTPHGYHDEDHYCSAMDLAIIGKEFFSHDELCRISLLLSYHIEADDGHNHEEHYLGSHNKMLPGCSYYYEGLLGSKTGYTDVARQTLVSCAENNGVRLICVIMKEESPDQFADTDNLFAYGFNNFTSYKVTEQETRFQVGHTDFFNSSGDLFGSTQPLLSVKDTSSVVLPNGVSFDETTASLQYDHTNGSTVAHILYTYNGAPVGDGEIVYTGTQSDSVHFTEGAPEKTSITGKSPIIINVKKVFLVLLITVAIILVVFFVLTRVRAFLMSPNRAGNIRKRRGDSRKPGVNYRRSSGNTAPTRQTSTQGSTRRQPGRRFSSKAETPEEMKARKDRELLAARKAAQAEIKSRESKAITQITRPTQAERPTDTIDTYRMKDGEMTTGYAKKPLPNTTQNKTTKVSSAPKNRPPQQVRRTGSFSDMYRVGLPPKDNP